MSIRILFVDDEPNVLDGLRRMLRPMRAEWESTFAPGGEEALRILADTPHDVIVSDMRMPRMDGAQLLSEVRKRYPHMVRIILSGHSDQEMILKSIGPTHQYLTKPCDPTVLRVTIQRAVALSGLLTAQRIRAVVSRMETLPSMPTLFTELVAEMEKPNCSLNRLGEIISVDVGMTAQILRLVNSAYFGLRREITSPAAAVTYLGLNTLTSLVMSFHIFRQVDEKIQTWLPIGRLWTHGMNVGLMAKAIVRCETDDKKMLDDAFSAGLIHDAGRLVLAVNFPDAYREILEEAGRKDLDLVEAEREKLGATHAEVGACLVGLWGLPNSLIEALAWHHRPSDCVHGEFSALTAVHVACALENADAACSGEKSIHSSTKGHSLDLEYLGRTGLKVKFPAWREACEKALREQAEANEGNQAA
jgi:HD-like signal output (HDOD) protein